jgi:hypothetical protein
MKMVEMSRPTSVAVPKKWNPQEPKWKVITWKELLIMAVSNLHRIISVEYR